MAAKRGRRIFDRRKNYPRLVFQQGPPANPDDINHALAILEDQRRQLGRDAVGDGALGDGFKVDATGLTNDFNIKAGNFYADGLFIIGNASDILYSVQPTSPAALTTPGAPRTDTVFLHIFERERTAVDDTDLLDPEITQETVRAEEMQFEVIVVEGGTVAPVFVGDSTLATSGSYTGSTKSRYRIEIDGAGAPGVATYKYFRWDAATDGDVAVASTVVTPTVATALSDALGVSIAFAGTDMKVGDFWEFSAHADTTIDSAIKPGNTTAIAWGPFHYTTQLATLDRDTDADIEAAEVTDDRQQVQNDIGDILDDITSLKWGWAQNPSFSVDATNLNFVDSSIVFKEQTFAITAGVLAHSGADKWIVATVSAGVATLSLIAFTIDLTTLASNQILVGTLDVSAGDVFTFRGSIGGVLGRFVREDWSEFIGDGNDVATLLAAGTFDYSDSESDSTGRIFLIGKGATEWELRDIVSSTLAMGTLVKDLSAEVPSTATRGYLAWKSDTELYIIWLEPAGGANLDLKAVTYNVGTDTFGTSFNILATTTSNPIHAVESLFAADGTFYFLVAEGTSIGPGALVDLKIEDESGSEKANFRTNVGGIIAGSNANIIVDAGQSIYISYAKAHSSDLDHLTPVAPNFAKYKYFKNSDGSFSVELVFENRPIRNDEQTYLNDVRRTAAGFDLDGNILIVGNDKSAGSDFKMGGAVMTKSGGFRSPWRFDLENVTSEIRPLKVHVTEFGKILILGNDSADTATLKVVLEYSGSVTRSVADALTVLKARNFSNPEIPIDVLMHTTRQPTLATGSTFLVKDISTIPASPYTPDDTRATAIARDAEGRYHLVWLSAGAAGEDIWYMRLDKNFVEDVAPKRIIDASAVTPASDSTTSIALAIADQNDPANVLLRVFWGDDGTNPGVFEADLDLDGDVVGSASRISATVGWDVRELTVLQQHQKDLTDGDFLHQVVRLVVQYESGGSEFLVVSPSATMSTFTTIFEDTTGIIRWRGLSGFLDSDSDLGSAIDYIFWVDAVTGLRVHMARVPESASVEIAFEETIIMDKSDFDQTSTGRPFALRNTSASLHRDGSVTVAVAVDTAAGVSQTFSWKVTVNGDRVTTPRSSGSISSTDGTDFEMSFTRDELERIVAIGLVKVADTIGDIGDFFRMIIGAKTQRGYDIQSLIHTFMRDNQAPTRPHTHDVRLMKSANEGTKHQFTGTPTIDDNATWDATDFVAYKTVTGGGASEEGGLIFEFPVPDRATRLKEITIWAKLGASTTLDFRVRKEDGTQFVLEGAFITVTGSLQKKTHLFDPVTEGLTLEQTERIIVEVEGNVDNTETVQIAGVEVVFER